MIVAAAASIAAMVVTPIARQGGAVHRGAAAVVVGGLAVTTFERLRCRSGGRRAGAATAAVVALGWAVEVIGEYADVAAMETLGFAAFFEDRTVALVGGAAMVPLAAVALRRVIGVSD